MRGIVLRWYRSVAEKFREYPRLIQAAGRSVKTATDIGEPFANRWHEFRGSLDKILFSELRKLGDTLVEVGLLLEQRREHQDEPKVRGNELHQPLNVTAPPSFAGTWLMLRLHRFQERHPEIDVRISASDNLVDLAAGDFDMGIRYGSGRYADLVVEKLLENEVFPACSPDLLKAGPPLDTPTDLRHHKLIYDESVGRDALSVTWPMWLRAAGVFDLPAEHVITFSSPDLALDAAIAGHGVVLAYSAIAAPDLAAGRLVRPFALSLPDRFAYYIVTAPGALDRPKVKAFHDWLREQADND